MYFIIIHLLFFFFSSRRRHTRYWRDWSSDVCSSDLNPVYYGVEEPTLDTGRLQHVADSKDCPLCGTPLAYDAVYMGHVGLYQCPRCSFGRPEVRYRASQVRLRSEERRVGKECRSRWS